MEYMEYKDRFCDECGKKLISVYTGKYNARTGVRITKKICPTNKCGHYGIEHEWTIEEKGLLPSIKIFCKRCGKYY